MNEINISVIIPTYNRVQSLKTILSGLINQSLAANKYEIIFVNDGSSDDTQSLLPQLIDDLNHDRKIAIQVINQENQGQAVARNNGAQQARGDVLVFMDDDMEPSSERFLEEHLSHHLMQNELVVYGSILPPANDPKRPAFEWFYEKSIETMYVQFERGMKPGGQHFFSANVSISRDLFLKAEGFNKNYRHAEDRELGLRLEFSYNANFLFERKAAAYHNSTTGKFSSFIKRAQLYGVYDYQMSLEFPDIIELSPFFFIVAQNPFKSLLIAVAERSRLFTKIFTWSFTFMAKTLAFFRLRKLATLFCSSIYIMNYVSSLKYFLSQKRDKDHEKNLASSYRLAKYSYLERSGKHTGQSFFRDMILDMKYILDYEGKVMSLRGILWLFFGSDAYPILLIFRLRKLARKYRVPIVNRILRQIQTIFYSIELGIDIELGHGVYFIHSLGTVIGGKSIVGNRCIFMGNNTLGAAHRTGSPIIGSDVIVGAGVRVLGEINVGHSSTLGANSVVIKDIPAYSVAVGSPAKIVKTKEGHKKATAY